METIKFRAWDNDKKAFVPYKKLRGHWLSTLMETGVNYEWMQYTGLKDKNGKEIWESDLVRRNGEDWIDEVIFKDGSFKLKEGGEYLSELQEIILEVEVIGNIYENPELLGS